MLFFAEGLALGYKVYYDNDLIEIVLADYSNKTGKRVVLFQGIRISVTIISVDEFSLDEYQKFVEEKLKEANVGLFPIAADRLVAAWVDPVLDPPVSVPSTASRPIPVNPGRGYYSSPCGQT